MNDEFCVSVESMQRSEREYKLTRAKAEAFDALLAACEKFINEQYPLGLAKFQSAVSYARTVRGAK